MADKKSFKPKQEVVVTVDGEDYGATVIKFEDPKVTIKYQDGNKGVVNKKDVTDLKEWEKTHASDKDTEDDDNTTVDDAVVVDDDLDNAIFDDEDEDKKDDETTDDETTDGDSEVDKLDEMTTLKELKEFRDKHSLDVKIIKGVEVDDLRDQLKDAYLASQGGDDDTTDDSVDDSVDDNVDDEEPKKVKKSPGKKASSDDDVDAVDADEEVGDNWFAVGDEEDDAFKSDKEKQTFRFSMKQDEEADIIILTSKPFTYKEHNLKMNGRWGNTFTCLTPSGVPCPLCEAGKNASTKKAFYIIDRRSFKSKDGKKTYKDQLRLMAMPGSSYKVLKKVASKYMQGKAELDYRGLAVTAMRSDSDRAPGTGDIFTVQKRVKIDPAWLKHPMYEGGQVSVELLKKEVAPKKASDLAKKIRFIQKDTDDSDD